jgi:hypothetical protein
VAKKFRAVVIILIGLSLTYWFLQSSEWALVGNYLSHVRLWPLLLAAVCINLTMLARALRWQVLLSPIAPIKLDNAVAATAIGFGSLFVVGRASEIIRPIVLSLRENLKPSATFATIMIERIYDTTAVVSLFAVNLLFFHFADCGERSRRATSKGSLGRWSAVGRFIGRHRHTDSAAHKSAATDCLVGATVSALLTTYASTGAELNPASC